MVNFGQIIQGSLEWTVTVLFRPFRIKKWIFLVLAASLAGYITHGSNFRLPSDTGSSRVKESQAAEISQPPSTNPAGISKTTDFSSSLENLKKNISKLSKLGISIIILIVLFFFAFIILMLWLGAHFSFVFLEDITQNDASIIAPFKENKPLGNSLFVFYLFTSAIFLSLLGATVVLPIIKLMKMGVFADPQKLDFIKIILIAWPYLLLFSFFLIISMVIAFINRDFVIPIMLKDKIKIMEAWGRGVGIIKANKAKFLLYMLLNIGLGICSSLILGVVSLAVTIGLFLPLGITIGLFALLYMITPRLLRPIYYILLIIVGVPELLLMVVLTMSLELPFAVFFRTLSIKFIAQLQPRYNLFSYI